LFNGNGISHEMIMEEPSQSPGTPMGSSNRMSDAETATLVERLARQLHRSRGLSALTHAPGGGAHHGNAPGDFLELPEAQQEAYRSAARAMLEQRDAARDAYERALSLAERLEERGALGEAHQEWVGRLQAAIQNQ
jgi:hypothetical protein